jgi:hypothetical protein
MIMQEELSDVLAVGPAFDSLAETGMKEVY